MVYTKAGGSYVVARDNFGPTVAQVAAVALMLDYIVTVAVQSAAGTAALASALPALAPLEARDHRRRGRAALLRQPARHPRGRPSLRLPDLLLRRLDGRGDHRGSDPGAVRRAAPVPDQRAGHVHGRQHGTALSRSLAVFYLLRAFANGGSSLTGLEAISNGVGAFRSPEGPNARRTLVVMSTILGSLVLGVSWLAHYTHAMPYHAGDTDRHLAGGARRPRRQPARPRAVLRGPAGHHAHPVHRSEHLLQRLPVPHQLRGRGLVPAPTADQARAPAGVLQRDHRAGRVVHRAAAGDRCPRRQAGGLLRDRRVHRVQLRRLRDGQALPPGADRPLARARWPSTWPPARCPCSWWSSSWSPSSPRAPGWSCCCSRSSPWC